MSIERLEKLLKSGSGNGLAEIIQRAQEMHDLTGALQAALPRDLGENLLSANLREDGQLALICSSSAWASRLRFESERLVEVTKSLGNNVASCRVIVSQEG
jgi:hypothetical protein